MKKSLLLCVLVPFYCLVLGQPLCSSDLPAYINNVVNNNPSITFGIHARAYLKNGTVETLFQHRDTEFFIPASNTKIWTSAAAISKYPSSFSFQTQIIGDAPNVAVTQSLAQVPLSNSPGGRLYSSAVYRKSTNQMYVWGGTDSSGNRLNNFLLYDITSQSFVTPPSPTGSLPTAREGQIMAISPSQSYIFVFGGHGLGDTRFNDVVRYDIVGNSWLIATSPSASKPAIRSLSCLVALSDTEVLMFFGSQNYAAFFNDVWKYDTNGAVWTKLSPSGSIPTARSSMSCVQDGDVVVIFGGHNADTTYNEILKYNITSNSWINVPTPSGVLPEARTTSTAVLTTDHNMIVFGGSTDNGETNSMAKYNIMTNEWKTVIPSGTIPSGRQSSVAVFDPNSQKMIIWSGISGSTYYNTLFEYQYVNDTSSNPDVIEDYVSKSLCIIASGDPTLTTAHIQSIANDVAARGVITITDLYIDGTIYKGKYEPGDWSTNSLTGYDYGSSGPFIVNRNQVSFSVSPASTVGNPGVISYANPLEQDAVLFDNQVTTSSSSTSIRAYYPNPANGLTLTGTVASKQNFNSITIYPSLPHFAKLAKNVFASVGVTVTNLHFDTKCPVNSIVTDPSITLYNKTISSAKLGDFLTSLMQPSDNLYSEALLRRIGADITTTSSGDTVADGIAEIKRVIAETMPNVEIENWIQKDGSGLSYNNKVTPRAIVTLLEELQKKPYGDAYKSYMPQGGISGTIASRFPSGTPGYRVIRAKTGTLSAVNALSGYVVRTDGTPGIAFSVLANDDGTQSASYVRARLDEIGNGLASWVDCSPPSTDPTSNSEQSNTNSDNDTTTANNIVTDDDINTASFLGTSFAFLLMAIAVVLL